jgi:hypothetical protein
MCTPLRVRATAVNDAGQGASQGTRGSIEAAAEWRRVVAERARFFGPVTERMLDLADLRLGGRVLDIGAGAGDQALAGAGVPRKHCLHHGFSQDFEQRIRVHGIEYCHKEYGVASLRRTERWQENDYRALIPPEPRGAEFEVEADLEHFDLGRGVELSGHRE